jgi:hypothetical protein
MSTTFFESVIAAGAILTGFCGTFLAFRIQREAAYYRQPALDFPSGTAKDVFIGLTHFTAPFLLLILATICALVFGFLVPLFAIAGARNTLLSPALVVAGLVAAVILLMAYFCAELTHYRILSAALLHDVHEWRTGRAIVIVALILSIAAAGSTVFWLR